MFSNSSYSAKLQQLRQWIHTFSTDLITKQPKTTAPNNFLPAYSLVYQLCNSKPSLNEKMLQQYKSSLTAFIQQYIHSSQSSQSPNSPRRFSVQYSLQVIQWFNSLWEKYLKFITQLAKKVFSYLDRHYLPGCEDGSLYKVAIKVFKENVCHEHNVSLFQNCYFHELRQIRQKKLIQSTSLLLFSQAIAIIDPQLINHLTTRHLQQTTSYYKQYHQQNYLLPSTQYYTKIYNYYLFQSTLIKMTVCMNFRQRSEAFAQFENSLVKSYTGKFVSKGDVEDGLRKMFLQKNVEFMKVVYEVYKRFEGFERIREAYYELLLEEGEKILFKGQGQMKSNNPLNQCLQLVDTLYTFYTSHINLLTLGFQTHKQLLVTLNNAVQKLISRHEHFVPMLYKYCSQSRQSRTFQENKQKITLLFGKISSKDQFIGLYQHELFSKYVDGQINLQEEEQFVNYLNQICGSQLTLRLVKKIKDFADQPQASQFKQLLPAAFGIKTTILSLQLWEKQFTDQLSLNITLPQQLLQLWRILERNFIQLQPKKKLIPLPFENKLLLQVKFNKKVHHIKCHLVQAAVFVFLASKSYCSEEELIVNLSLEKNILQSTIETLQTIPNLLLKTSLGDYIVNWYFDQSETQIDLLSKSPQISKQISKTIKQDRQILVQAAIVKFIKRSKTATFEEIVVDVIKAIRLFKPQPSIIKAGVDKLIKKGFIEQSENGVIEYIE